MLEFNMINKQQLKDIYSDNFSKMQYMEIMIVLGFLVLVKIVAI